MPDFDTRQVNDHPWLRFDHGQRAIADREPLSLELLAVEADRVGATDLARHWRKMADIIRADGRPSPLVTAIAHTDTVAPGFWVADAFASTLFAACIVGPFDTAEIAERERCELNIAADCDVVEIRPARELPADWGVSELTEADVVAQGLPRECAGWLVTRDHGAQVVGLGYVSRQQALDVARRTLQS